MEVRLDRGLHRSLRFRDPKTISMYFDINTWPGFLSISGDMGDYTFARIADMFEFFRPCPGAKAKLPINLGYWQEKVQAEGRRCGVEEWSAAKFKRQIYSYMFTHSWPSPVRDEVADEVFSAEFDGEHQFTEAAFRFRSSEHKGRRYSFDDLWDHGDARVFTYQFVWCCYAIVWAIRQYDRSRARPPRPEPVW